MIYLSNAPQVDGRLLVVVRQSEPKQSPCFSGEHWVYSKQRTYFSKEQKMEGMRDYVAVRQRRPQLSTDFSFLRAQVIFFFF